MRKRPSPSSLVVIVAFLHHRSIRYSHNKRGVRVHGACEKAGKLGKKIFVFDTNVVINNPYVLVNGDFADNIVVIPFIVVEELDSLKKSAEAGYSAREATRIMEDLSCKRNNFGEVLLKDGGVLLFHPRLRSDMFRGLEQNPDNEIIATAFLYKDANPQSKIVLISDDTNALLKAHILGLDADRYSPASVRDSRLLDGVDFINLTYEECQEVFSKKASVRLDVRKHPNRVYTILCDGNARSDGKEGGVSCECFMGADGHTLRQIHMNRPRCSFGFQPRDHKQAAAWDVLTDKKIELVALIGGAGTGKTILSIAAGIQQVLDGKYEELIISRPAVPVGDKDRLGFLKGTLEEKLEVWLEPIFDNIYTLLSEARKQAKHNTLNDFFRGLEMNERREKVLEVFQNKFPISIVSVGHLRGRTFRNAYVIIDEGQNTDKLEIKTIVTRAGEGTKIVLAGDITQIDIHPYGGQASNGVSLTAAAFADEENTSIIHLSKVFRSHLAEQAVRLL